MTHTDVFQEAFVWGWGAGTGRNHSIGCLEAIQLGFDLDLRNFDDLSAIAINTNLFQCRTRTNELQDHSVSIHFHLTIDHDLSQFIVSEMNEQEISIFDFIWVLMGRRNFSLFDKNEQIDYFIHLGMTFI